MTRADADLPKAAAAIRRHTLNMVAAAKASHVGGGLSAADIFTALYWSAARVRPEEPSWLDRDRIILSKGHCCSALYATLAVRGFFPIEELVSFGKDGSRLMAHASRDVPGVEFSTGSLGHGLPFGVGRALAAMRRGLPWRTFVVLSDGELDEGSNWEAFLFAAHHGLDNLVAIIDYNKIQSLGSVPEVMGLEPLAAKLTAFNWAVREVDGHCLQELRQAMQAVPWTQGRPSCLIAHTTKGKGVDFMENDLAWHYKSPSNAELAAALEQLETN
jgi:transketolase